jgi:hypothetical protein
MYEHFDLISNPFKYKGETSLIFIHSFQKKLMISKSNLWVVDLTTFKVNDSTHVQMLIVQNMRKNSLNHSNIIAKYWVACVLIYYNKWKMQFVNNDFNILKVNGSTMIIEEMWKKSLIHSNINVGFEIVTCVLINFAKCKMQPLSNGFNMLKIDSSNHVPC